MNKTDFQFTVKATIAHAQEIDPNAVAREFERRLSNATPGNYDDRYVLSMSIEGGIVGGTLGAGVMSYGGLSVASGTPGNAGTPSERSPAMSKAFEASYGPVKVETPGPYATAFAKIFSETGIKSEGRLMAYITSDADWSGIKGIYVTDKSGDKTVWCRDTPEQPSPSVSLPEGWKLYTDTPQRLILSKRGETSIYVQPGNEEGSYRSVIYRFMEDLRRHLSEAPISAVGVKQYDQLVEHMKSIANMDPNGACGMVARKALRDAGINLETKA
jgi:hypothetical protein